LHPPPERISPDPDAPLQASAKSIWCSASSSPGNTRARPRTSSRKLRRTLVLFANIATPASHDIPEDKDPERVTFLSVRDRRGPDLALERDHEGDRKSTRLNSSHDQISYAVFCLKKKK